MSSPTLLEYLTTEFASVVLVQVQIVLSLDLQMPISLRTLLKENLQLVSYSCSMEGLYLGLNAEFYAAFEGSRDAVWFKAPLMELGIDAGTILIYCDSKCARSIIGDPGNHQRVKHINVKSFFVL